MSAVLAIARRDIAGYLASPKAAAVFFFFLLIMGLFFYSFTATLMDLQQRAAMGGGDAHGLHK